MTNAEQYVLAALFYDNNALDKIPSLLPMHFGNETHRRVFETIMELVAAGTPADVITVMDKNQWLPVDYLHKIASSSYTAANIETHAGVVMEGYLRRKIIEISQIAIESARDGNSHQVIQDAIQSLDALTVDRGVKESVSIQTVATEYIEFVDRVHSGVEEMKFVKTGLIDVDNRLGGGLVGGDLVIIAGRPSTGKSALAGTIQQNNLHLAGGMWSLEMQNVQIVQRHIASLGGIDGSRLRSGGLVTDDWPRLTHAIQQLQDANVFLNDQPGADLGAIRSEIRRLKRLHDIQYYIVDYLQIMDLGNGDNVNREIGKVTMGLKNLAKELDIPIIVLSQFNRGANTRADQKPRLADLRDSGSIEQDADIVIAPHRDLQDASKPTELLFLKNRAGATEPVFLTYLGSQYKFVNFSGAPTEQQQPQTKKKGYY